MNIVGPSRLVLLRAGKYDYGEVELINPLHLVGQNNVGKTSLIAVLQFLYIDDQRSMHFSREMHETRKYYFPDQNSYLLFECLTPTGYQVVGVQGSGPIRAYQFQRFAYQGQYDPTDYLDEDRRIRAPEVVRARLAAKDFRLLEPSHLRAALIGSGENRGVNLGLVPIKHKEHYERFRVVFGNLLRLAYLRQDELKQLLLEIYRGEFQQPSIDLESGYSVQYQKACREAESLRELNGIVDDVRRVLEVAGERDSVRRLLPGLWAEIQTVYRQAETEIRDGKQKIEGQIINLNKEITRVKDRQKICESELKTVWQSIGAVTQDIEAYNKDAEEFKNFLIDFEKSKINDLELQKERVDASLGHAAEIPPEQVRARVERMKKELEGIKRQREQFSRNVAAKLLPMLSDIEMEQVFQLINPEILGLIYGKDGLLVKDEKGFEAALKQFADQIQGGFYEDNVVQVSLAALGSPDLTVYRNAQALDQRIFEQEEALAREQQLLKATENAEAFREKKKQLKDELAVANGRLIRFEDFQKRPIQQWRQQKNTLEKRQQDLEKEQGDLAREGAGFFSETKTLEEQVAQLNDHRRKLQEIFQTLKGPDPSWPLEVFGSVGQGLDALLSLYDRKWKEHDGFAQRFEVEFRNIEQRTYSKYLGENEAATLAALKAEMEGLEERDTAVQRLWKGLAVDLQCAFKGLNGDIKTLTMRIDELNRRLGSVSISNLTRLKLIIRERPEWISRIKTVVEAESTPLFAANDAVDSARSKLGELLSHYRRVELSDLFDLHFEVTGADNKTQSYPHLDSIESTGTTITIKVLINLLLLKGLLDPKREVSIPFYLDEAESLDQDNLAAIVNEARKMGFVAILASPQAMGAADSVFYLREQNGRVMLDPKTSARIRIERGSNGS